jgi:proteasome alpha subunit
VFSPDGRLFQVEYAREAVKSGSTSIGIMGKEGIALMAHKRISSPLIVGESHEKVFQIDEHIVASSSGLAGDARRLIDLARVEAQRHKLVYDEPIPVEMMAKHIGDHIQFFTQYAGVRPYGVSLLLAGVDKKMHLFETDPSGALFEYKAAAIGSGKKAVEDFLEKEYDDKMPLNEATKLAVKGMRKVVDEKLTPQLLDVAFITLSDKKVKMLSKDDVGKYL